MSWWGWYLWLITVGCIIWTYLRLRLQEHELDALEAQGDAMERSMLDLATEFEGLSAEAAANGLRPMAASYRAIAAKLRADYPGPARKRGRGRGAAYYGVPTLDEREDRRRPR